MFNKKSLISVLTLVTYLFASGPLFSKNYVGAFQVQVNSALPNSSLATDSLLSVVVPRLDQAASQPMQLSGATPASALLQISTNRPFSASNAGKTSGYANDLVNTFVDSTINYQTGATTGGTVQVSGGAFSLPSCTIGQFKRHVLVYNSTANKVDSSFSAGAASVAALTNAGALFASLDGLALGFVDLECTTSGAYKTAGSATSIVENSVSSVARVFNFDTRSGNMAYQNKQAVTITGGTISGATITATNASLTTPSLPAEATLSNIATPSTPSAGSVKLYSKSNVPTYLNSSGVERVIANTTDSLSNPMTTSGDIIYGGAAGIATRLPGAAGVLHGAVGAPPSYSTIVNADVDAAAAIDGSKLVAASGSVAGAVTTGNQTLAGEKNFTSQAKISSGTVSEPALVFSSDDDGTGTGLYRVGADSLGVASNGINTLTASSAGAYTVGPATGDVEHVLRGGPATANVLTINNTAGGSAQIHNLISGTSKGYWRTTSTLPFSVLNSAGSTDLLNVTDAGAVTLGVAGVTHTLNGRVQFNQTNLFIGADTSDASDTKLLNLGGGGGTNTSSTRGSFISLFGNEFGSSQGGQISLMSGDSVDAASTNKSFRLFGSATTGAASTENLFITGAGATTVGPTGAIGGSTFPGASIVGQTDGSTVAAGYVGQKQEVVVTTGTNFPTTSQYGDLGSIVLTPGVYLLTAQVDNTLNGATATQVNVGISTTTGNSSTGLTQGNNLSATTLSTAFPNSAAAVSNFYVNISSTTTYYAKVFALYTVGTPQYRGRFTAIRIK